MQYPKQTDNYDVDVFNNNFRELANKASKNDNDLLSEIERAKTAERTNANAIAEETIRAKEAEKVNADAIKTESDRAIAQEALKAPIANPTFTGTPKAPTAPAGTNTTQIATTQFVQTTVSNHNTSSTAHDDIRRLITGLTTRLNALIDTDDTTLDQLSEIVAYIKSNRSLIDSITTSKVSISDIIDNLTSTATNRPLSAKQGKVLKDLIDTLTTTVGNKVDKVSGKGLSTNDYTTTEKTKLAGIATGAEVNVQSDWNVTDSNSDSFIKNKPTSFPASGGTATKATQDGNGRNIVDTYAAIADYKLKKHYAIDLTAQSTDNFYAITFPSDFQELDCEIHSPIFSASAAYNQNILHFLLTAQGWNDAKRSLTILNHTVFDTTEITIASIICGNRGGVNAVYVRGGLKYDIWSTRQPTAQLSNVTFGSETFASGTPNCYTGEGSTNVNVPINFINSKWSGNYTWQENDMKVNNIEVVAGGTSNDGRTVYINKEGVKFRMLSEGFVGGVQYINPNGAMVGEIGYTNVQGGFYYMGPSYENPTGHLKIGQIDAAGNINLGTVSGTNARIIGGKMASNDWWQIAAAGTADNAGFLDIGTGDDGSEPIYLTQYRGSGDSATITRRATLLDSVGNTSFPGCVDANGGLRVYGDAVMNDKLRVKNSTYVATFDGNNWNRKDGYAKLAKIVIIGSYNDGTIMVEVIQRRMTTPIRLFIVFSTESHSDPNLKSFTYEGDLITTHNETIEFAMVKESTSTWLLYYKRTESNGFFTITDLNYLVGYAPFDITYYETDPSPIDNLPSNAIKAKPAIIGAFGFGIDANGNYGYIKRGADAVIPFEEKAIVLTANKPINQTTVSFTHSAITSDATFDFYTNVFGIAPKSQSISGNTLTLTFTQGNLPISVKVRILPS